MMNRVTMYSTGCPNCDILRKKLNEKEISYNIVNDREIMKEKGFTTIPMLEIEHDGIIETFNFLNAIKKVKEL